MGKPFQKDNFEYDTEIETYICPLGEIYIEDEHTNIKTNKE